MQVKPGPAMPNGPGYGQGPQSVSVRPPPPGVNGFPSTSVSTGTMNNQFRPGAPPTSAVNGPYFPPSTQQNQTFRPGMVPPGVGLPANSQHQMYQRPPMSGQTPVSQPVQGARMQPPVSSSGFSPTLQGPASVPGIIRPPLQQPVSQSQGLCKIYH